MRYRATTIPQVLERMERNQAWLARKMGVSTALMTRVLKGERGISPRFVERACVVLDLPASELFQTEVEETADVLRV